MQRDRHGFTLLELVVALGIGAVLAGISLLAYQRMAEALRLNQAARQVVLALTAARSQAMAENTGHRIVFRVEDHIYQPQQQLAGRYDDAGSPVSLPVGIDVTACPGGGCAVTFHARGNAFPPGTITLRGPSGDERRVIVNVTGRIRVE